MNAAEQQNLCRTYGAPHLAVHGGQKLGVSLNVRTGIKPINGLRHLPEKGSSGWYVWAGEALSQDPDFFCPLHIEHVEDWVAGVTKFLGLAPGWRFLIANGFHDVWFDETLVSTQ